MSVWDRSFRRRARPEWMRTGEVEVVPLKRLRGLDEFVAPEFVGRMERIAQARQRTWRATVAIVVVSGLALGWLL